MNYSEQMVEKDKNALIVGLTDRIALDVEPAIKDALSVFEGLTDRIASDVEPAIIALHESVSNLFNDIANIIDLKHK